MGGVNDGDEAGGAERAREAGQGGQGGELGAGRGDPLAELARLGETRESALAAFGWAVARAKAATEPPPARGRPEPTLLAGAVECEMFSGIRFHDERVAAGPGLPLGAEEGSRAALPSDFFGRQDWGSLVAARVSGWSMRDAGIADGDTVLVDTRREARDGDIVLAHLGGHGQVVKRLRLAERGVVWLASDNPECAAIAIDDPASLTIHGVVVARSGQV